MDVDIRLLEPEDADAAWTLTRSAFALEHRASPADRAPPSASRTWGAFDARGRLVGKATDRAQAHWFGGRLVGAAGVAGVAVEPELRRAGIGRRLMTQLLAAARDRGAAVSTLFRTTPIPYRRLGYEDAGALTWTTLPTASLAGLSGPAGLTLRRAETDDVPAVLAAYRAVARAGNGLMERAALDPHDGLTIAVEPGGEIEGYATWDRPPNKGRVVVPDLVGLSAPATLALLAMLGSWAAVAGEVALRLPDPDPARLLTAFTGARVESEDRWMLRILDAEAAIAARGWPPHLAGAVDLDLRDEVCPWNAGARRLVVERGSGRLEPGARPSMRLAVGGLALLYAAAGGPALLRRAGLLEGGTDETDAFLSAAFAGPAPTLLDFF
jgi:predicted acetyltransferase